MSILGLFRRPAPDPGVIAAGGQQRSPKWDSWLKAFLRGKSCIVCGQTDGLTGHHVIPFHLRPDLELDAGNVVPICSDRCHLLIGHLNDYTLDNPTVREDAAILLAKRRAAQARKAS